MTQKGFWGTMGAIILPPPGWSVIIKVESSNTQSCDKIKNIKRKVKRNDDL